MNKSGKFGPGVLVAAAFIGPGTVTVCTLAGAQYGFVLLWSMVFSVIATIILQEMSARLGVVARLGVAQAIRQEIKIPVLRTTAIILVMSAILVGNAAYEAGNISGGVLGLETLSGKLQVSIGQFSLNLYSIIIGVVAFLILYKGSYKAIEKTLITLVLVMSFAFVITAIMTQPNVAEMLKGLVIPSFPEGSPMIIIALIGTTVVPYNLFLHASLVQEKWQSAEDLSKARTDTVVSVLLGGLISIAIIISATAMQGAEISNAVDLAKALEPVFGSFAKYLLSIGLFAAGITSAITAPLAAAYVAAGCFNWNADIKSEKFRRVWIIILLLGIIISSFGFKPIEIIKFAQIANGILLPFIAGFLLWLMSRKEILGQYVNSKLQNSIGWLIALVTLVLGLKSLGKVFGLI